MTDAIVEIVRKGDADRFLSVMAAPADVRLRLFTLYAFNTEVARAPWASSEELISEMRLQWWRDAIEALADGKPAPEHEVMEPLIKVIRDHTLPLPLLAQMVNARRWDIYRDPFENMAQFERYIDQTSGNLMWLAARSLGAVESAETAVRAHAYGVGVANWLLAVPELSARGRAPLLEDTDDAVSELAQGALTRMRTGKGLPKQIAPALRAGWQAKAILKRAIRTPSRVKAGHLRSSEFARRGSLLFKSMTGRW